MQFLEGRPVDRSAWPAKVLENAKAAAEELKGLPPTPPPPVAGGGAGKSSRLELEAKHRLQRSLVAAGGLSRLDLLLRRVEEHLEEFDSLTATTALVWAARVNGARVKGPEGPLGSDRRFVGFCGRLCQLVPDMAPGQLSSAVWSISQLGVRHEAFLESVAEKAIASMPGFGHAHLSTLCWGLARLGFQHEKFLERLPKATLAVQDRFSAVQLCNVLWAFAEFGIIQTQPCAVGSLLDRLLSLLQQDMVRARQAEETGCDEPKVLNVGDLVELVKALILCHDGHQPYDPSARLLAATAAFTRQYRAHLGAGDLCNLLWAFATSERWAEAAELLEPCAACFPEHLQDVGPGDFASAVWALGVIRERGGCDLQPLLVAAAPALEKHALRSLPQLREPGQLSGLMWGFASAGLDCDGEVAREAATSVLKLLDGGSADECQFSPTDLCCILRSFALKGLRHEPLFTAAAGHLEGCVDEIGWDDLASAVWACGTVAAPHQGLLTAVVRHLYAEEARAQAREQADQDLGVPFPDAVLLSWALTGGLQDTLLREAVVEDLLLPAERLASILDQSGAVDQHPEWVWPLLQQVLVAQLDLGGAGSDQRRQWLEFIAERVAALHRRRGCAGHWLRQQICGALQQAGSLAEADVLGCSGHFGRCAGRAGLLVDVALPMRGLALVAESRALTVLDLPTSLRAPNGNALLLRSCLELEGWKVHLIPREAFRSRKCLGKLRDMLRSHPKR